MKFKNTFVDCDLERNRIRRSSDSHTFGLVRRNFEGSVRPHQGWDLYAVSGTKCFSISKGTVKFAGERGALGQLIVISIDDTGYYAAYAHMSKISVAVGDEVKLGQMIGLTGNSGNASSM